MKVVSLLPFGNDMLARLLDESLQLVPVAADDREALRRELPGAEILISARFDAELAPLAGALRLIQCPAAGTESIDRALLPHGALVANASGHEIPMAEFVMGALVALRQQMFAADRALRRGEWQHGFWASPQATIGELYGSTLGMLGYGAIGREITSRAVAFGIDCRALTFTPNRPRRTDGLRSLGDLKESEEVDELLAAADAVVICCELSPLTLGLVDARRLALMKPDAVLVNVARGAIVDERALYETLRGRRIAGAALDVWYAYPERPGASAQPSSYPFAELDNVIMSPHASGWSSGQIRRKMRVLARNLNAFAANGRLP